MISRLEKEGQGIKGETLSSLRLNELEREKEYFMNLGIVKGREILSAKYLTH